MSLAVRKRKLKADKDRIRQSIVTMYSQEKRKSEILEHVIHLIYEICTQDRNDPFTSKMMLTDIEELCFTTIAELSSKEFN